ncbi:hypothetical protein PGB90_000469 [Kerria lacca]
MNGSSSSEATTLQSLVDTKLSSLEVACSSFCTFSTLSLFNIVLVSSLSVSICKSGSELGVSGFIASSGKQLVKP